MFLSIITQVISLNKSFNIIFGFVYFQIYIKYYYI